MKVVEVLKSKESLIAGSGVDEATIKDAELKIGVTFSADYKEYLMAFGLAMYSGHEMTGLGKSKRTNVVDVTIHQKELNGNIDKMYVIEESNIDGIVIWQSSDGTVYATKGNSKPTKICDSLAQYIGE